jgi:LDH2 family malate/lactate/ureidoglycolate dehydrogenase
MRKEEALETPPPAPSAVARVTVAELRAVVHALLASAGADESAACATGEIFVEGALRGKAAEAMEALHELIGELRSGALRPDAEPELLRHTDATALLDGKGGMGQRACLLASHTAVERARNSGFCTVGVTNSGEAFFAGYFAEQIARQGLAGLMFSTGPKVVHPLGGVDRKLGSDVLAMAVPQSAGDPIVHEMRTSEIALPQLRDAAEKRRPLANGVALGPDGRPTNDPLVALAGALSPLAGHKGYGLALVAGLLCSALLGKGADATSGLAPGPETGVCRGHFLAAINPDAFVGAEAFRQSVRAYAREVASVRKAPGAQAILMPGEAGFCERRRALDTGIIPLDAALWERTRALAVGTRP